MVALFTCNEAVLVSNTTRSTMKETIKIVITDPKAIEVIKALIQKKREFAHAVAQGTTKEWVAKYKSVTTFC